MRPLTLLLTSPLPPPLPLTLSTPVLRSVASKTEGYSGREISKLAIAWQAAAYGNLTLTYTNLSQPVFYHNALTSPPSNSLIFSIVVVAVLY